MKGGFRERLLAERRLPPEQLWAIYEDELDRPLREGINTAHEACDRWARDRARLALIVRDPDGGSERWTFAELSAASMRMAAALRGMGLERGDRVAALLTRQIEAWIGALAAWRAGLVYLPLFVGFGADALAQRLGAGEPGAVLVDRRFRGAYEAARELLDSDPAVITVSGPRGRGLLPGDRSFWAELERRAPSFETVATTADEPATLLFTSGTTGPPKGCVMPHSLILAQRPFLNHTFGLEPSDMFFTGADPGWAYGLYTTGAAVSGLGHPRVMYTGDFSGAAWLQTIESESVTYASGAPSAFRQLVAAGRRQPAPDSLRGATCAGEPLDPSLASGWRELTGSDLQDGYGQTELGMVLANFADDEKPLRPGALASVTPGFEVALFDENGEETGEQGVLHVKRPRYQATITYWREPELWARRWRGEWFSTGDVFRRDEDGYLWFVGRDDDLIVTSGYNVGPAEVEAVLLSHPEVTEAAVVAADDPARGKVVRAVVVRAGSGSTERLTTELQEMTRTRIGRHAYPRLVDFVDELPRTETGKLRRSALRQQDR